jgi:hypothetical protein
VIQFPCDCWPHAATIMSVINQPLAALPSSGDSGWLSE